MKILVINAGSSSLKFQLIDMDNEAVIAKGICEEIGGKSGFKYKVPGREDYKVAVDLPTHADALQLILDTLVDEKLGVIASVDEIGAVNDIAAIAQAVKKHRGSCFHCDITQALGKIDLDLHQVDMASFSAHKIHGLKGSGALIRKEYIELLPIISGGQQEFSLRGGTSNALTNIVLAKTLRIALENKEKYHDHLLRLRDILTEGLKGIAKINYEGGLISLVNISTPIPSEVLLNALNAKGIMVSSKSTCGSRENEPNRTLRSMHIDEDHAIRVSFDYTNNEEEMQYFIDCLKEIIEQYAGIAI